MAVLWASLVAAGAIRRTWDDGYRYALVATGRVAAMVDPAAAPYDLGPMPVILREAGGRFTDVDGTESIETGSGVATQTTVKLPTERAWSAARPAGTNL